MIKRRRDCVVLLAIRRGRVGGCSVDSKTSPYCENITAMTSHLQMYDVIANLGQDECNKLRTTYCDVANIEVRADKGDRCPSDNWRQFVELPLRNKLLYPKYILRPCLTLHYLVQLVRELATEIFKQI